MNCVLKLDANLGSRIPSARQIVGLRNRLIHAYLDVDPDALWGVVESDLEPLERAVARLLDELGH